MPVSTDELTAVAIRDRRILVDIATGVITRPDGTRAELVRGSGGRVQVYDRPRVLAPAHRAVWIAAYGLPPARCAVRHRNRHAWDNRITNLYLSRTFGFVTYRAA